MQETPTTPLLPSLSCCREGHVVRQVYFREMIRGYDLGTPGGWNRMKTQQTPWNRLQFNITSVPLGLRLNHSFPNRIAMGPNNTVQFAEHVDAGPVLRSIGAKGVVVVMLFSPRNVSSDLGHIYRASSFTPQSPVRRWSLAKAPLRGAGMFLGPHSYEGS